MCRDDYIKLLLDMPAWPEINPRQLSELYYEHTIKRLSSSNLECGTYLNTLIYGLRCPLTKKLFFVGVTYEPLKDFREKECTFGYSAPALSAWLSFLKERSLTPVPVVLEWTNSSLAKSSFEFRVTLAINEENPYLLNQFISNQGFFVQADSQEAKPDTNAESEKVSA